MTAMLRATAVATAMILALSMAEIRARQAASPSPPPDALESGDFLWPKLQNAVVPYNSGPGEASVKDKYAWEADKKAYLNELVGKSAASPQDQERFRLLAPMSYEEFVVRYLRNESPSETALYTESTGFAVGHVAIVDVRNNVPWIVEATLAHGVRELTYGSWLKERSGELIWHARLRVLSAAQRVNVAERARAQIGKPYRFFNFDLADDTGFYCSKLAWLSVWTATQIALDDNPDPHRALWYSPKQMLKSTRLNVLHNPAQYSSR